MSPADMKYMGRKTTIPGLVYLFGGMALFAVILFLIEDAITELAMQTEMSEIVVAVLLAAAIMVIFWLTDFFFTRRRMRFP